MAFTLTDLVKIIDDCIEEGTQIGIVTNKHIARIIEQYLEQREMYVAYNVFDKPSIPFDKITSDCLVVIDCKDMDYDYYIDHYTLNERLPFTFDEFIWIGEQFENLNSNTIKARDMAYARHIEINDEDIADIFADEFDYEDCDEESPSRIVEGLECVECCVECEDEDCEFNGIIEDCGCDECEECREDEEDEDGCQCDECRENKIVTEEDFLHLVTEAILSRQGCFDCTYEIVEKLVELMKVKGWEAHREYIRECNEME